ncbi:hypothetical protein QA648_09615 [Rhizobium sp. CB3171]|uniref:hypothetical protein n=1 Tax=unclassified Rhizobium TaxID=2613769 RepID=UPI000CDF556F|nr:MULTISPECIES: hypothetical protein [Rhizobium]AVA22202.1 hypothetical protein NXC24_CH02567 [Rhizobium sp. NXC24]UWU19650.1 hypothetical protein N2601_10010 [Rhizobium tropici]WFU03967.1 hypothetical protein QA648_09615 [Rhizobium sp. CB3171]
MLWNFRWNVERKQAADNEPLAVNSASLQLFSSCQNQYPNSAQLATPLIDETAARIAKSLTVPQIII